MTPSTKNQSDVLKQIVNVEIRVSDSVFSFNKENSIFLWVKEIHENRDDRYNPAPLEFEDKLNKKQMAAGGPQVYNCCRILFICDDSKLSIAAQNWDFLLNPDLTPQLL